MEQENPLMFKVLLTVKDLWKFSLYQSYRGLYGIFSLVYVFVGIYVIVTTWSSISVVYRVLLIGCYLLYMVYKPGYLYVKAYSQFEKSKDKEDLILSFGEEGVSAYRGDKGNEQPWENVNRAEQIGNMMVFYMKEDMICLLPDSAVGNYKQVLHALIIKKLPPERRKRI